MNVYDVMQTALYNDNGKILNSSPVNYLGANRKVKYENINKFEKITYLLFATANI